MKLMQELGRFSNECTRHQSHVLEVLYRIPYSRETLTANCYGSQSMSSLLIVTKAAANFAGSDLVSFYLEFYPWMLASEDTETLASKILIVDQKSLAPHQPQNR